MGDLDPRFDPSLGWPARTGGLSCAYASARTEIQETQDMKILFTVAIMFLTVGLSLTACRPAGPAADAGGNPTWMPPDQQQPQQGGPDGGGQPQGAEPSAAPRSVASFVAEWMEIGLTEEQIRSKIAEGMEIGALPQATAMNDDDKAMLQKAGATTELVDYLGTLELPDEITDAAAPKEGGEGAPPKVEGEGEGDSTLLLPADQKKSPEEDSAAREAAGATGAQQPDKPKAE
jgi:hypothetical protein